MSVYIIRKGDIKDTKKVQIRQKELDFQFLYKDIKEKTSNIKV